MASFANAYNNDGMMRPIFLSQKKYSNQNDALTAKLTNDKDWSGDLKCRHQTD